MENNNGFMDLSTYWEYKTCPLFVRGHEGEGNSCGVCKYRVIDRTYGSIGGYRALASAHCEHEGNRGKQFFDTLIDCD